MSRKNKPGFNINPNPLKRKKQVHVEVDYETYVEVRSRMFKYSLTLPAAINEFLRLIKENDPLGDKIVQKCYNNLLARNLAALKEKEDAPVFDPTDTDALYDMISEAQKYEQEEDK